MSAANHLSAPEIARKVLELLGPNGENWRQGGGPATLQGPNCLLTAAMVVCESFYYRLPFYRCFDDADPLVSITSFNDSNPFPVIKERLEILAATDELPRTGEDSNVV